MTNKNPENRRRKTADGNKKTSAKKTAENDFAGELRSPRWSVVSFEEILAKNLTYEKAEKKVARLEKQGVSGLCIITDEAAARISPKK